MKKTGVFGSAVIWFGAAVSVAEIEAGVQSGNNWPALVLGHVLGGVLLFFSGLLGAQTGENAMETTRSAFGGVGMHFIALLNVVQLIGWTTVMVSQGASAVSALGGLPVPWSAVVLAALVAVWVWVCLDWSHYIATVAVALLAVLAVILTARLVSLPIAETMKPVGFRSAFELSVAMPLSWLPLISDYSRRATRPVACTAASVISYTLVSLWMYAIGMLMTRCGAEGLTSGVLACGLGMVGLVVVAVSTATSTFLDAFSVGESLRAMCPRVNSRYVGIVVCGIGAVLATTGVVSRYVDFLYLIASVFAPMAAVLLVHRYLVRRACVALNMAAWMLGVGTYFCSAHSPIGATLSALLVSAALALLGLTGRIRFDTILWSFFEKKGHL